MLGLGDAISLSRFRPSLSEASSLLVNSLQPRYVKEPWVHNNSASLETPVTVMFACRQNAGRSQIAAALMKVHAPAHVTVLSAGTTPAIDVHPETMLLLEEMGLSLVNEQPQKLTHEAVQASDWVITMGCGETCPIYPGRQYEDWPIQDPSGQPMEIVREIRDDIQRHVTDLLNRIVP